MRIIAGRARGRRLTAPAGSTVRPTADRVREALFSSLQDVVVGARVLDLYAGAGGLGLEAASRGAREVVLVERDRRALKALHANVAVVAADGVHIVANDVRRALTNLATAEPFDLALLDPPYAIDDDELAPVLDDVVALLAPGAIVVVERSVRRGAPPWPDRLRPTRRDRYGDTELHRAERADAADTELTQEAPG